MSSDKECLGSCYGKFCEACQGDTQRVALRNARAAIKAAQKKFANHNPKIRKEFR